MQPSFPPLTAAYDLFREGQAAEALGIVEHHAAAKDPDAIFTLENRTMKFKSYYKMPAPQTAFENCVAHNGSMIPIPGRDVMVQAWYQGGLSVFDWTDASRPMEIAYFDRGPVDSTRMGNGGSWSVYWYNGVIVSSESQMCCGT